jgi:hypothetical protein
MKAEELNHLSPPQDQDTQARKKPRLEEPFSASTDENVTKLPSLDTIVALPPPAAAVAANHHADSDPVMDMDLNASTTRAFRRWTVDEDTRLKKSVLVQTHDGKRQSWNVIAALVPCRTKTQCCSAGGIMSWIPVMSGRLRVRVNGHQTKTTS